MARPEAVDPVKLLVAILWGEAETLDQALHSLRAEWGRMDFTGPDRPFDVTDYYVPEMGKGIRRRLVSFASLAAPEDIRQAKLISNGIEEHLAGTGGRRVNLDIGYLDRSKIVLASVKFAGQKIHLGDGVYADMIARYKQGRYQPFEWTFPDFQDGRYDEELAVIRRRYLAQLKRSGCKL